MADLAIVSPTLQRIHQDWQNRRNGRTLPSRASFDIVDFKYILGNLNLVEVLRDPLRFRYRVHGTNCASLLGYDMTWKFVDDYPDPVYRARAAELCRRRRKPAAALRSRKAGDRRSPNHPL